MTIGDRFRAVLENARAGDDEAYAILYHDLAPLVLGYARGRGAHEPEDVASEVFVSMVRGLSSFSGTERQFRSWVLTITHRRVTDDLRGRGRRKEDPASPDEIADRVLDLSNGDDQALARLRARGVLEAIDQLTEDQRSVLLLRVLADLPIRDVAEVVGKEETAVKALQRRALASIRRRMAEGPGGAP